MLRRWVNEFGWKKCKEFHIISSSKPDPRIAETLHVLIDECRAKNFELKYCDQNWFFEQLVDHFEVANQFFDEDWGHEFKRRNRKAVEEKEVADRQNAVQQRGEYSNSYVYENGLAYVSSCLPDEHYSGITALFIFTDVSMYKSMITIENDELLNAFGKLAGCNAPFTCGNVEDRKFLQIGNVRIAVLPQAVECFMDALRDLSKLWHKRISDL